MLTGMRKPPDELDIARVQQQQCGIPERDYQAWSSQRAYAKHRGIPFQFTLREWWLWWKFALPAEARRGKKAGDYMMRRKGDRGAFEPENVYAGKRQKAAEPDLGNRRSEAAKAWHRTHASHLKGKTGAAHPKARAVRDQKGVAYPSLQAAADAHSISRQYACIKAKAGVWRYLNAGETT